LQGKESPEAAYRADMHDGRAMDLQFAKGLKLDMVDAINRVEPLDIPPGTVMDSTVFTPPPPPPLDNGPLRS